MEHPLVLVEWVDATRSDGDIDEEMPIGMTCYTVGWLVSQTEEGIRLAMSKDDDAGTLVFRMGFTIPRAYINSIFPLRKTGKGGPSGTVTI